MPSGVCVLRAHAVLTLYTTLGTVYSPLHAVRSSGRGGARDRPRARIVDRGDIHIYFYFKINFAVRYGCQRWSRFRACSHALRVKPDFSATRVAVAGLQADGTNTPQPSKHNLHDHLRTNGISAYSLARGRVSGERFYKKVRSCWFVKYPLRKGRAATF